MAKLIDMTGWKNDYLKVLGISENKGKGRKPEIHWICECICGTIFDVKGNNLRSGHTVSCGCKKYKHGGCRRNRQRGKLYNAWVQMKTRCYNTKNKRYHCYGAKGITVCDEWRHDFIAFRDWAMASGYEEHVEKHGEKNTTIDRYPNQLGNYEPSNCRWATLKEQVNNFSRNRIISYKSYTLTMSEWADMLGLTYSTMIRRVQRNWDMEKIVSTPGRTRKNEFNGLPNAFCNQQ